MTESNLSPPMASSDLSLELLMLMEVTILRRVAPRTYYPEGLVPDFYTRLFPQDADGTACRVPWKHSPMLEFFLGEAEEFFESEPKPGESLSSGLWVENLDSGDELPLTATARVLKNSQVLLIQAVPEEYAQRVRLTRRSQTDLRSREDLMREKRKITQTLLKNAKRKNPFDPLTKLYNREALTELLQAQISNLPIYAPNLALIMISLNHPENHDEEFVKNNDLLLQLGQMLRRFLRKSDAAVHYGGGMFFIVAPGTTLPQAILAAERLIVLLKGHDFGLGRPLSPYLGCTSYRPGEEAMEFIVRARQALLDAVKTGPHTVGQRDPLKH